MRKDNKILLVFFIFLTCFGATLVYINMIGIDIAPYGAIRTIGGFVMFIGFILLLAAIGRERARRD